MEDNDIMNCLFERMRDISHFRSTDEVLRNYGKVTKKAEADLDNFINKKIPPCLRRPLERLIEEKESANYDYYDRESFLYYNSGFAEAIQLILSNALSNNDCSI